MALGKSILGLLNAAESFVVEREAKKTIIAGYHWFGEWGRDAMISLPGLTLINGKFDCAEKILEHFLNNAMSKGIPSRFVNGNHEFNSSDATLWMIDRVYQYSKYAGPERTKAFLHTYWWRLKDIIKYYSEMERDGILYHKSGTWMDTLKRDNAVEIQGLWYNSLRIMEKFADIAGESSDTFKSLHTACKEQFLDKFWTGRYLRDCLNDDSLRPNQIITTSLDFTPVDKHSAKKIMDVVDRELLTPFGLRTLDKNDSRYLGEYTGNFAMRERAYHNGTVWPWLLGPYIKTYMRLNGDRSKAQKFLENLIELHLRDAGIGTISEVFDGDSPHTPRGCISQAWSVAELLRTYFEDVMGRMPKFEASEDVR